MPKSMRGHRRMGGSSRRMAEGERSREPGDYDEAFGSRLRSPSLRVSLARWSAQACLRWVGPTPRKQASALPPHFAPHLRYST